MCHKDFSPKHSSYVSVSLIKAFLGNSLCGKWTLLPTEEKQVEVTTAHLNKGRAVEEHSLVALIVVFLRHLSPPVTVFLPKFGVPESWFE